MSCEGDANLNNDAAADFLADLSDALFERVKALMEDPHGHEYDDKLIAELFVRIEMILALHDRGMIRTAPEQGEIAPLLIGSALHRVSRSGNFAVLIRTPARFLDYYGLC